MVSNFFLPDSIAINMFCFFLKAAFFREIFFFEILIRMLKMVQNVGKRDLYARSVCMGVSISKSMLLIKF